MPTLLDIAADVAAIAALVDDCDAELTPDVEEALTAWFAEVRGAESVKLDGYACYIRTLELRAAARKEEQERLAKLVASETNKAKRLKERLRQYLEATGQRRIDTARYRVTLAANGGKAPLVTPANARDLPPEYGEVRTEFVPDMDRIRAALERGETVPGCSLLPRGNHVRIA